MSDDYFSQESGSAGNVPHKDEAADPSKKNPSNATPDFMSVGTGIGPRYGADLQRLLEADSGYGGSIASGSSFAGSVAGDKGWHAGLEADQPTPPHVPTRPGETNAASEHERRALASHVHQLYYNQNRVALGRSINRTVEALKELQRINSTWPAHYPAVAPEDPPSPERRPGLQSTQSSLEASQNKRPGMHSRAFTSQEQAESSNAAAEKASEKAPEPRLISAQLAQQFSILKLDLKLGAASQADIVHSLEKGSIASLLDGKINQSIKHLLSLRDRIEDTSSKVLVTGDLNAGKSTFCNALLRRKVLPEDQQPCTHIFCEVLDARENGGIEEVHAVHKETKYNRNDESTYDAHPLKALEKLVQDSDRYGQAKIYVDDIRTVDQSLLRNGVVDISLIDAPGLNVDSLKTTAVFARQEEIDVVVFVVSAENHFTESAREFIWNAAHEKAYIFIVVNRFDNIRDKERCERAILKQVAGLSPHTYKEASELVHFVSSNAVPVAPGAVVSSGGSGSGTGGSDPSPDDDGDDGDDSSEGKHGEPGSPKGKGKDRAKVRDFENLEQALRRFVLEKRARSKLAPAKTYLLNVLSDLHSLSTHNRDVARDELKKMDAELEKLEPSMTKIARVKTTVSDEVDRTIEETCQEVYNSTRTILNTTISSISDADLGVEYPGLLNVFAYAAELEDAMMSTISSSLSQAEDLARAKAADGVKKVTKLGRQHLGDEYEELTFKSELMFRRKKDESARQLDVAVDLWDVLDISSLWEKQEKVAGSGMALTVVGMVGGRLVGGSHWLDSVVATVKMIGVKNIKSLIIPSIVISSLALLTYSLVSIPQTLPHTLSRKLRHSLYQTDYVHTNSNRLSQTVRRVLRYPAEHLRIGLQRNWESVVNRKRDVEKTRGESTVALKWFSNLVKESEEGRRGVERVDVEGVPQGLALDE